MAIAAGKSVLCEKPLAESVTDAEELYAFAEKKGVMLQEGMWYLFRKARTSFSHFWLCACHSEQIH